MLFTPEPSTATALSVCCKDQWYCTDEEKTNKPQLGLIGISVPTYTGLLACLESRGWGLGVLAVIPPHRLCSGQGWVVEEPLPISVSLWWKYRARGDCLLYGQSINTSLGLLVVETFVWVAWKICQKWLLIAGESSKWEETGEMRPCVSRAALGPVLSLPLLQNG